MNLSGIRSKAANIAARGNAFVTGLLIGLSAWAVVLSGSTDDTGSDPFGMSMAALFIGAALSLRMVGSPAVRRKVEAVARARRVIPDPICCDNA